MKIRITAAPSFPEPSQFAWLRRDMVGMVFTVSEPDLNPQMDAFPVLVAHVESVLRRESQIAATAWRQWRSNLPGRFVVFPGRICEIVPEY